MIFSWLASHLAVGGLFSLLFVPPEEFGRGLHRFTGVLAALLLGVGLAGGALRGATGFSVLIASVLWVALAQGASLRWLRSSLAILTAMGVVALVGGTPYPPRFPVLDVGAWAERTNSILAATLLGSVALTLLVGHWYLVIPGLEIRHLRRMNHLMRSCIAARGLAAICALLSSVPNAGAGELSSLRVVAVREGFFFWQRVGIGLAGPAVLAWMVERTVRIRSTQSATGLLYVTVVLVLIGEMISRFLWITVGIPQ